MESDVEAATDFASPDSRHGDGPWSGRQNGPVGLADVTSWVKWAVEAILRSPHGKGCEDSFRHVFQGGGGLQICTDYSGMGTVEMAIASILDELSLRMGSELAANVRFYRAADIAPLCRDILMSPSRSSPEHVFGNVTHRVPVEIRNQLWEAREVANKQFASYLQAGFSSKEAACLAGDEMAEEMIGTLETCSFASDARAWCYKHKRQCRIHGPPHAADGLRLVAAGTTCTYKLELSGVRQRLGI